MADIVEEVAERVDKIAEGAAKNLPEGKLQDVAEFVENVAENVDKLAEEAGDLLEKVLTCVPKITLNVLIFIFQSQLHLMPCFIYFT